MFSRTSGKLEFDSNVNVVDTAINVEDKDGKDCRSCCVGVGASAHGRKLWKTIIFYAYAFIILFNIITVFFVSLVLRNIVRLLLLIFYRRRIWLIEDRNGVVWGYESTRSSANIVFVLRCEGVPDLKRIIDDFDRKVLQAGASSACKTGDESSKTSAPAGTEEGLYAKLRWIIRRKFLYFCWEEDRNFAVGNHFFMEQVLDQGNDFEERISQVCENYLEKQLDICRPQWEFRIISRKTPSGTPGRGYAVVFTVHHIYGDGISWMQMFTQSLADDVVPLPLDPLKMSRKRREYPSRFAKLCLSAKKNLLIFLSVPSICLGQLVDMLYEKYPSCPRPEIVDTAKRCKWATHNIPLARLKSLQRVNKYKKKPLLFTSILMAAASNAYYRSLESLKRKIPKQIVSGCPYALYPYKSLQPTNNFVLTILRFPAPVAYGGMPALHPLNNIVHKGSTERRIAVNRIGIFMGASMPIPLMKLVVALTVRCSIGLSNLPGPTKPFSIFGSQVTDFNFLPPIKFQNSIIIGVLSYNGLLHASLGVDSHALPDTSFPSTFIQYMEQELDYMTSNPHLLSSDSDSALIHNGNGTNKPSPPPDLQQV